MTTPTLPANEALAPIAPDRRVFGLRDHASLWFSLGVGLLVMQVGAYLMPALGTKEALLAIVGGSLIGAGMLGWVARIGCDSGLASAGLMHAVYGRSFARLPIVLNIVQLLGWGTFELVIMRDATVAIGRQSGSMLAGYWPVLATLLWGGVITLLISGSMVQLVRRIVSRVALPLVVLSLLWLTWKFLGMAQAQGLEALWQRRGEGGMGVLPALDLVIAMPISWLPLVADYARHGKSGSAALRGTWAGYALANIWCYALGVLVALVLPMHSLEPFLLTLSSVFVPLFGVILGCLAGRSDVADQVAGARAAHGAPIAIWIGGIAFYHLLPQYSTALGSALPTLALSFVLARVTRTRSA